MTHNNKTLSLLQFAIVLMLCIINLNSSVYAASASISIVAGGNGGVTATGTGSFSSCTDSYGNVTDTGSISVMIPGLPSYACSGGGHGGGSCTTVIDRGILNGSTGFTATASDCTGTASQSYVLTLDNTPNISASGPSGSVSGLFDITGTAVFQPTLSNTKGVIYLKVDNLNTNISKSCISESCSYSYANVAGTLYELPHGAHTYQFSAFGGGVSAVAPAITFTVDNTPIVNLTAPTGTVSGLFDITGTATFKPSLKTIKGSMKVYMDNFEISGSNKACYTETCSYSLQQILGHLYELPHGNHTIKLVAFGNGISNTVQQVITVDNTPLITLTSPGAVVTSGLFDINGTVVFKSSLNSVKGSLSLYVDNFIVSGAGKSCSTENCSYSYQSLKGILYELSHGNHTVKLVAYANGINTSTQQVVFVDNTPSISVATPSGKISSPTDITGTATFKPSLSATKGTIKAFIGNTNLNTMKTCTTEVCSYDYKEITNALYGIGNGGPYTVKLMAYGNGVNASALNSFTVESCNLAIASFAASPTVIDPRAGQSTTLSGAITGTNGSPAVWTISINGQIYSGTGTTVTLPWAGKGPDNRLLEPGNYTATLTVQTITNCSKTLTAQVTVTADTTAAAQTALEASPVKTQADPNVCFGSTANAINGNLSHSQTLFTISNSKLLDDFVLSYNSLDSRNTPLGKGWTHTFNITLSHNANGTYTVTSGDGGRLVLYQMGVYYKSASAAYPLLTVNSDGSASLQQRNGLVTAFDQGGKLTSITDLNSNSITLTYTSGNLTGITDPSGRSISLIYGSGNRIRTVADPGGNVHSFTYSGDLLTSVLSQIAGIGTQTWAYTYDSMGFMLNRTDPSGHTTTYGYDTDHKVTQAIDPEGRTRSMSYNPGSLQSQFIEKNGGLWTFKYDTSVGALTEKQDPLGNTVRFTFDTNKNLSSSTDQRGNATSYTYDSADNITSVTDSLDQTTSYTYNFLNKVTSVTDPAGGITSMTYDARGNLTEATDPAGSITQYAYDPRGNLITVADALGHITSLSYDAHDYLTSITEPTGAVTAFVYDSAGNMVSITDALGNLTRYQYNGLGKPTQMIDPQGRTISIGYSPVGDVTAQTDGNGNTTSYMYNYRGQVTSVTDAAANVTSYVYGGTGCPSCGSGVDKLTSLTDAKGNMTIFQYDLLGRLIRQTNPTGTYKTYSYDPTGNPVSMTDENGNTTSYTSDALNRLTQVFFSGETSKTFGYDSRGRMVSAGNQNISYTIAYDPVGRPLSVTDSLSRVTAYQYDSLGRRTQLTTPDGRIMTYSYDAGSKLSQISAATGVFDFTYDTLGHRTSLSYPNGVSTSYIYSPSSEMTSISARNSQQAVVNSFMYGYDNAGNKISLTDTAGTHSYNYDHTYQLLDAVHPSPQVAEQYNYDQLGNRTGTAVTSNNSLLEDSRFAYSYDSNGNLTLKTEKGTGTVTSFVYDFENRLIGVQGTEMSVQYQYDPFGRRIEKRVNGVITRYTYDDPNIVAEYDGAGGVVSGYVHALSIDDPLSVTQLGQNFYFHKDSLGSITDLTDSSGVTVQSYDYDSYGNITAAAGTLIQPFTFTGREFDPETGLYFYRERYYDAEAGRFITRDPLSFAAGDVNVYRYVGNNGVNYIDPLGLFPDSVRMSIAQLMLRGKITAALALANEAGLKMEKLERLGERLGSLMRRYPSTSLKCDKLADTVYDAFREGGVNPQIIKITDAYRAQYFIDNKGSRFAESYYHKAVRVGDMVYDALTGPDGLQNSQYVELLKSFKIEPIIEVIK